MTTTLSESARNLVAGGKGILRAGDDTATAFPAVGVADTAECRRAWCELLLTASAPLREAVSGVLLSEEMLVAATADGRPFVDLIAAAGALAGVRVAGGDLAALHGGGARFAVVPAAAAAACQAAGLVPVVELDPADAAATVAALADADLAAVVLAPGMHLRGSPHATADATLAALQGVPAGIAGIAFRCGEQRDEAATEHLALMVAAGAPWPLTFAFGRALERSAQKVWHGRAENVPAAQSAFALRAAMNARAAAGRWRAEDESAAAVA